jgi:hypothetical protein
MTRGHLSDTAISTTLTDVTQNKQGRLNQIRVFADDAIADRECYVLHLDSGCCG